MGWREIAVFASTTDDALELVIDQTGALIGAAHQVLLEAIREVDRRSVWETDGASSLVDWVTMRLGCERRTANRLCRIAADLAGEPELEVAFGAGLLSLDQV